MPNVKSEDLKDHHFKEKPKHTKNPKIVQTRNLKNSDIEKAGKNGPAKKTG